MRAAIVLALLALLPVPNAVVAQVRTHNDRYAPPRVTDRAAWESRASYIREHVLATAGLVPRPERTPLNAVIFDEQAREGYSVAKVYFESLPGLFVTGNLYKPVGSGPFPAILSAHGHWPYGRLEHSQTMSGPARAINLARQGFVVLTHDMIGYNDSQQLPHTFGGRAQTLWGLSLGGLQLWNGMRALDFLQSLSYVRRDALGATGESGGGSQTFLLAAADPRVSVAVPVNMISFFMQGGCLCENQPGLRVSLSNVEIAAAIAPRPLLMVAATGDWTRETLESEYPVVKGIYGLMGAADRVSAVRFDAEHNYNQQSREAMYGWMGRWLAGAPAASAIKEPATSPAPLQDLLVFYGRPRPVGVTPESLTTAWIEAAKRQLTSAPLSVRASALRHALHDQDLPAGPPPARRPRRKVAVVAGLPDAVTAALRTAGFAVTPVPFMPFDTGGAEKTPNFEGYNRTEASQRMADIVTALRNNPDAVLVAAGDAALAGILAAAIAPPRLAILDAAGFDTSRDADYLARLYIPGVRRAGDVQTASEMVPGRLVIHNTGAAFRATGASVRRAALSVSDIVALATR